MSNLSDVPIVMKENDASTYAGQNVLIEGTYRQEDVRMMRVNPKTLFLGHVTVELDDGCRVFLYPPESPEAIRSKGEIREFANKRVRVRGIIYPRIPQEGAIQLAPCLMEIQSISRAAPQASAEG